MRLKAIIDEDFTNYKKPSMFIGTISCGGKCCTEAGIPVSVCQNDKWREAPVIDMEDRDICYRYIHNEISTAIVFGGLEPFEQYEELKYFIHVLREEFRRKDDVVIYTGYEPNEIWDELRELANYPNIIVKFGRYLPGYEPHFDDVLGVKLASPNQYAEKISVV